MIIKGIISKTSPYSVKETVDRLVVMLTLHDIKIYARIDQQEELQSSQIAALPMEYLLFGSPKHSGPLMVENPLVAIDLPMKIIVWQSDDNEVFVTYNDAVYLSERFGLHEDLTSYLSIHHLLLEQMTASSPN